MDKSKLREVTSEESELICYRCKQAPAAMVREMRTPNGSVYLRGWCMNCVEGRPFETPERIARTFPSNGEERERRPFRVGTRVNVRFSAKILYFGVGKYKDHAFVQIGKQAFEVPASALRVYEEESDD